MSEDKALDKWPDSDDILAGFDVSFRAYKFLIRECPACTCQNIEDWGCLEEGGWYSHCADCGHEW